MLAISPVYGIQLWITKDYNVSEKSRVTRTNGLCSQLNAADKWDTMGPLKLLRHLVELFYCYCYFFTEKVKQKYFFSSNTFQFIKKAWTWAKWTLVSAFSLFFENGCNFNIKTLKPSLTEQGFFLFFFSMVTVLDMNEIMGFLKLADYYIQKKRTLIQVLVLKNTDYTFLVYKG